MSSKESDFRTADASDETDALRMFEQMMKREFQASAAMPEYTEPPKLMTEALKADPRGTEMALRNQLLELARGIERMAFGRLDDRGPSVVVGAFVVCHIA